MEDTQKLTAANIRYLLTMKSFADADKPIRNIYLAEYFHYKKSSIHSMLKNLTAIDMIETDDDNRIRLTEKGADTAFRYQQYYIQIDMMMQKCFPDFGSREGAILALLAEIPEFTLKQMIQQK